MVTLSLVVTAVAFCVAIGIPLEDIITEEKLAHEGKNRPKDIRRNAEEWVKNHQALVDGWLGEARIAGKAKASK